MVHPLPRSGVVLVFGFEPSFRYRGSSQTEQQKKSFSQNEPTKDKSKEFLILAVACSHISTACAFQINWFVIYFLIIDISHVIFHFPPFLLFSFTLNDKSVLHSTFLPLFIKKCWKKWHENWLWLNVGGFFANYTFFDTTKKYVFIMINNLLKLIFNECLMFERVDVTNSIHRS